jgi:thiosulfate/3-mercaptopyruvate sulfurtransferase
MASPGYAHPELLAEPSWLEEHLEDDNVRVIDCATLDAYRRAHIRGAVGLPVHIYIKDSADETFVMPPDQFAALMGRLGVGNDTTVVTYDDNNSLVAARLWWALNYYGHTNAKVLNGGWHRWLYEQRPVTTHATHTRPATFTARAHEELICDLDGLKAAIGKDGVQILDVRTDEEWLGTNDRGNKRRGHIPGAIHLEWLNFISKDDRRTFLPADELRALLSAAGVKPEAEIVTY